MISAKLPPFPMHCASVAGAAELPVMSDVTQAVIEELRTAFPPHALDPENMFSEWGVGYTDAPLFKKESCGKPWDELPTQFLEFHHDALLFLGPTAIVELIPAYLAAALRKEPALDMLPTFLLSVLNRNADPQRFDARFGRLTRGQRRAITQALEVWAGLFEDSPRRRSIIEALESDWRTTRCGQ
jgi:hypothetical protein